MRRTVSSALLVVLLTTAARPASTQFLVNDPPHTIQTIAHYIARALEIAQRYQQIANEVKQIANQVQALKKLASPNWRDIEALLLVLDERLADGLALAYSIAEIDRIFLETFPGYTPWSSTAQWKDQLVRTLETMRSQLSVLRAHQQSYTTAEELLGDIRDVVKATEGHQEQLELISTIEMHTTQELVLIRQLLASTSNAQAVYYAYQLNREAQAHETAEALASRTLVEAVSTPSEQFSYLPPALAAPSLF